MKKKPTPSVDDLRKYFRLDPETGSIYWTVKHWERQAGDLAGSYSPVGYRYISLLGKKYPEHRVAFALHHGRWPDGLIDHIDRDKLNNRPNNLRESTKSRNAMNASQRTLSKSGYRGVSRHRRKWISEIRIDSTRMYLGLFDTPEDASAARLEKLRELYGSDFVKNISDEYSRAVTGRIAR